MGGAGSLPALLARRSFDTLRRRGDNRTSTFDHRWRRALGARMPMMARSETVHFPTDIREESTYAG
jgi:hypothetical protein